MSQYSAVGELKHECQDGWDFIAGMWGVWLGMKRLDTLAVADAKAFQHETMLGSKYGKECVKIKLQKEKYFREFHATLK